MIKLFITDIDGCLTHPFEPPDWDLLSQIRELNVDSDRDQCIPKLSICSGRPLPYVEAVAQWLGISVPVVFESGGIYELRNNKLHLNGILDDQAKEQIDELKKWIHREILGSYPEGMVEFSKMMDAGFIHPEAATVYEVYEIIRGYVSENYPDFEVHHTDVSVNVILSRNNKRAGIERICNMLGFDPGEVAYIGDSSGDIPGLNFVGHAFAPSNARDEVKKVARVVPDNTTKAVLVAYKTIISQNRSIAR